MSQATGGPAVHASRDPEPRRTRLQLSAAEVGRLTRREREARVDALIQRARELVAEAMPTHAPGRNLRAVAILYSGGNDSTVLAHLFRADATHAIHANTGIGIEETRRFVRSSCEGWGLPLIEKHAGDAYREFVLNHGFPGPALHFRMYQRLKERCLDAARVDLGVHRSRTDRALFIAGIRREESARRSNAPLHQADGSVVWVSPLAEWTKLDLNTYRLMCGDVPRNRVAELLHMSGECLCGSFAKSGELDEVAFWFPETAAEIRKLERQLARRCRADPQLAARIPIHARQWGWGSSPARRRSAPARGRRVGMLCTSCEPAT